MANNVTFTINTSPANAKVEFRIRGTIVKSGEAIHVPYGSEVTYKVTADGYIPVENTIRLHNNTLLNVYLAQEIIYTHTVKVIPNPSDATVTLESPGVPTVTGTGTRSITVRDGAPVIYTVSKENYQASSGTFTSVADDITTNITIYEQTTPPTSYNVTVNTFPDNAKVLFYDVGTNFEVYGKPTINYQLHAYDLSTTNYFGINIDNNNLSTINNFEIVFKILTPKTPNAKGRILNVRGNDSYAEEISDGAYIEYVPIEDDKTNICRLAWFSRNYDAYLKCNAGVNLQSNTWYYVKWIYSNTNNKIIGYYSTDGSNWKKGNEVQDVNNFINFHQSKYLLGVRENRNFKEETVYTGSIDLSSSYIKINDIIRWQVSINKMHTYMRQTGLDTICTYTVIGDQNIGFNWKYKYFVLTSDITVSESLTMASGTVLFESSTPGNYQVTFPESRYYTLNLVGAGGGGAGVWNSYVHSWQETERYKWHGFHSFWKTHTVTKRENRAAALAAGGGSGSRFYGSVYIPQGTYTVTVGEGGESRFKSMSTERVEGFNGGETIITCDTKRFRAVGGKPGVCQLNDTCETIELYSSEVSPTYQIYKRYTGLQKLLHASEYGWVSSTSGLTAINGIKGNTNSTGIIRNVTNAETTATGGPSVYNGYGKGSKGSSLVVEKAGNGYVKIEVV